MTTHSGWADVEQVQAELISVQAEVEAAERMLEAARLLPGPAGWPDDVKRLPNAELGRPFSEFDEDLAGDRIEGRQDWIWLNRPRDLHPTGPWAGPFEETGLRRMVGDRRPTVVGPDLPQGTEASAEPAPASKGLLPEDREAFLKRVEDFTARKLEGMFEERTATIPEWVKDSADWIRETDRDHPEVRPMMMAAGAALSLSREVLVALTLDDEQAAEYRRFMERIGEYQDLAGEAVRRSVETYARKKGLNEDDIDDLKLVASTGIFAAAAIGGPKLPKKKRHEDEAKEPDKRENEPSSEVDDTKNVDASGSYEISLRHAALQTKFEDLAEKYLWPKYIKQDPNLDFGYRGSFKTGKVGNRNKPNFGAPIDLTKYDIDAFVRSDVLFQRHGSRILADTEFREILYNTPGFEGLKPYKKGFSVKIFPQSKQEIDR